MTINMPFAVDNPDDNSVKMTISCDMIVLKDCNELNDNESFRGAGGIYGNVKGFVPNLVQSGQLKKK